MNTGGTAALLREARARWLPSPLPARLERCCLRYRTADEARDPGGPKSGRRQPPAGPRRRSRNRTRCDRNLLTAPRRRRPRCSRWRPRRAPACRVTIARLFNQIGPGQPAAQVPAGFAAAIAGAEADGESRWSSRSATPPRPGTSPTPVTPPGPCGWSPRAGRHRPAQRVPGRDAFPGPGDRGCSRI